MELLNQDFIYGINPVKEALFNSARPIEKILFTNREKNQRLFELLKECKRKKIPYQVTDPNKLKALAKTENHQGVVAICGEKKYDQVKDILDFAVSKNEIPLIVVADSVEDPRNLGALIRTSLAAGAHGVIIPRQGGCGITSAVVKASAGATENILITKPNDIEAELKNLSGKGFEVAGLDKDSKYIYTESRVNKPLVVVIGGEDKGIRPHILRACTKLYSIQISPLCNSLNLSVAAGIFLFETIRQRNLYKIPQ